MLRPLNGQGRRRTIRRRPQWQHGQGHHHRVQHLHLLVINALPYRGRGLHRTCQLKHKPTISNSSYWRYAVASMDEALNEVQYARLLAHLMLLAYRCYGVSSALKTVKSQACSSLVQSCRDLIFCSSTASMPQALQQVTDGRLCCRFAPHQARCMPRAHSETPTLA